MTFMEVSLGTHEKKKKEDNEEEEKTWKQKDKYK